MRTLKYLLIAMLLFVSCGEEPKVFEQGGKTYYQDSSGDLYILVGTKKVKVEDYVEPPKKEEPEFVDTKFLTRVWTIAPYNLRVNLNLRYLAGTDYGLMWRVEIKDARGKPFHETKYGKRLDRKAKGEFLQLRLESSDEFDILEIPVIRSGRSSNCTNRLNEEAKIAYYECQGKISSVSKETFSLIEELGVVSRVLQYP